MEFENVRLVKAANVYFDGKVTSRTFYMPDGERKTLGFMVAGEYEFGTAGEEIMEVMGGSMDVKLPGSDVFVSYGEGTSFSVPAQSSFVVKVGEYADYCCSYK
ncbi:MAG: pyrimidine/purine nucleoside phosphorylase [Muricomes sp.]